MPARERNAKPLIDQSNHSINQSKTSVDQSNPSIDQSKTLVDQSNPSIDQSKTLVDQSNPLIDQVIWNKKKRMKQYIQVKFSLLSGKMFELSVNILSRMRDILHKIDKHIFHTNYRLLYDNKYVNIHCKITAYYLPTGVPIQIIKLNDILYYRKDLNFSLKIIIPKLYIFNIYEHITLPIELYDVNYSYTGMPKIIKSINGYRFANRGFDDVIYELESNSDDTCCNIFQLQIDDMCIPCINKLYILLKKIYDIWKDNYIIGMKELSLVKNELSDAIFSRFKNSFYV